MAKTLDELYANGDISGLMNRLYEGVEEIIEDPLLLYGPLVKSKHTYDLEKIFKHIIRGKTVDITIRKNPETNVSEYMVTLGDEEGQEYNLSKLLEYGNLNHIRISRADEKRYIEYIKHQSTVKPKKSQQRDSGFPDRSYFEERDKEGDLQDLSYAEMLGINIYTSAFYGSMNALLRGKTEEADNSTIKDALVHSIVSASGLNKVSNKKIKFSTRGETLFSSADNQRIQDRIEKARNKQHEGISLERGFISTAAEDAGFPGDIKMVFTGVVGKKISALSQMPEEREFLIPPTQVRWKKYRKEGNTHFFHAEPVSTLTNLPVEAQEIAEDTEERRLQIYETELKERVNDILINVQNIRSIFAAQKEKFYTDPKREVQMAYLALEANKLLRNEEFSPEEKLKNIEGILKKMHNNIEEERRLFFGWFSSKSRLSKGIESILEDDLSVLYDKPVVKKKKDRLKTIGFDAKKKKMRKIDTAKRSDNRPDSKPTTKK